MRQKTVDDERRKEDMKRALDGINSAARKAYEKDKSAQERQEEEVEHGTRHWKFHQESGYYYNPLYGWYYDVKSKMYYGGSPPDWTDSPNIPSAEYYGAVYTRQSDPLLAATEQTEPAVRNSKYPQGMRVTKAHPLADIGGYQMPTEGVIGGGRGVASSLVTPSTRAQEKDGEKKAKAGSKRKKDDSGLSKKEREFLEKREAARKRVQKRTMEAFGLQ